eukprot:jgi/Mesvir1/19910/Mv13182-RA.1
MVRRNRDPTAKPRLQAALRVAYEQAEKADAQHMVKDLRTCQQKNDGKGAWFWYKRSDTRTASAGPTATMFPEHRPSGSVPGPRPLRRSAADYLVPPLTGPLGNLSDMPPFTSREVTEAVQRLRYDAATSHIHGPLSMNGVDGENCGVDAWGKARYLPVADI